LPCLYAAPLLPFFYTALVQGPAGITVALNDVGVARCWNSRPIPPLGIKGNLCSSFGIPACIIITPDHSGFPPIARNVPYKPCNSSQRHRHDNVQPYPPGNNTLPFLSLKVEERRAEKCLHTVKILQVI
jgi:hypothetical protein